MLLNLYVVPYRSSTSTGSPQIFDGKVVDAWYSTRYLAPDDDECGVSHSKFVNFPFAMSRGVPVGRQEVATVRDVLSIWYWPQCLHNTRRH